MNIELLEKKLGINGFQYPDSFIKAIELNLYTYEDYKNNPVNYCGLILNTNIMD